jgi:cytoskeleton-associated protein 5
VVAGRLTSTVPVSTPPPIASVTSPKFAPMSPVHVKTINIRPDSNNAYSEDDTNGTASPVRLQADLSTGNLPFCYIIFIKFYVFYPD